MIENDGRHLGLYKGKTIWARNPSEYVNKSQWSRGRKFYDRLYQHLLRDTRYRERLEKCISPLRERIRG
jgi:hypothetical protein